MTYNATEFDNNVATGHATGSNAMKVAVFQVIIEDHFKKTDDTRLEALCEALDESSLLATAVEALESELRLTFGNRISVKLID